MIGLSELKFEYAMAVKSADRVLRLFELFATEQKPLSVGEIAAGMSIPQSSTSMLLKSLIELGYIEHDDQHRSYYPTFRIALLGTWMRRKHEKTGRLPKLASKVAELTGETVILAMRNGIFAQYVLVQPGPDPLRLHVESGMQRPLACCASGWALLSYEQDREIEKIIRRTQAEAPNALWRETAEQAVEHIKAIQQKGYVMSRGQTTKGAGSIAMLLPAEAGRTALSVAVGGPIDRIEANRDFIIESLKSLSAQVNARSIETLVSGMGNQPSAT